MAKEPQTEFVDDFSEFSSGMNSGIAPLSLPKNQYAYGTNTTCRGRYLTHRPAYRKISLIPDTGVSIGTARFQGACYYKPDFGSESIVTQIGGRIYQFLPDAAGSASVYDRTIKSYFNGVGFSTSTVNSTTQYSVQLQNINDASVLYPASTVITSCPSFISVSTQPISVNPVLVNNNTQIQYTFLMPLPVGFNTSSVVVGSKLYVGTSIPGQLQWNVISNSMTVGIYPALQLQYTAPQGVSGSTITYPANEPLFYISNPYPPATVGVATASFNVPAIGSAVTVSISAAYPGTVGQGVLINGFNYSVLSIPAPVVNSTLTTQTQTPSNNSSQFAYDPNPANISTAWLWQSENYVIINDGSSRPVVFDGINSTRSVTPTFVGTNTASFFVPQIGQTVVIPLSAKFQDAVGTYLQVSPLNYYPFLMQVVKINGNTVTAANVNGQTQVGLLIPISTPVISTNSPPYSGVLATNIPSMVAIGASFQTTVAPPYTGNVGDSIILTDGAGSLTSYTMTVTAISGGGANLTLTNLNAPLGTVIPVGYPVLSENTVANELPVGRMGAYVQGRNWISSPDGKYFIASDLVGDSSGSQALNFRDSVLKWSINTTRFSIPGGAGQINCIIALAALDASLGQGPLQVLCDNDIFTCSAPADATLWANLKTPILSETIIGFGGTGQNAAVVSNSDLIFKSGDATIHSLKLSRDDFNQWGNLPISQEVNRIIQQENINQLSKLTFAIADNRCLESCSPIDGSGGIYSQGLIACDYDVTSSLQGKLPSVYDGVWIDLNVLQMVSGKFNKVDRTFVFHLNTDSNQVELWEVLKDGTADDDGSGTPAAITWSFESPMIFNDLKNKGEFDLVQLKEGEIYFSQLVGTANVTAWYRPDFDECWHPWLTFPVTNPNPFPSYFMRAGLGEPSSKSPSGSLNKIPATVGRFFQVRIEIQGSFVFQGAKFKAALFAENKPAEVMT